MHLLRHRVLSLALLLTISLSLWGAALPVAAQGPDTPLAAESVTPKAAPARYSLGQLKYSVQTLNNCGPAAVVSAMSYYDIAVSQTAARKVLRPYSDNRGMSQTVIPPYVAQFGLQSRVLVDGDRDVIKTLVANDIPVIVLQWVSESWRIGHFRVVQGYDDAKGVFYVNDSLLGPNLAISYASFDARWDYNWSRYLPVYRPSQAALVNAILGPDADKTQMFARRVPALQAAIKTKPTDRNDWNRLVEALTESQQYQAALDTLDAMPQNAFGFGAPQGGRLQTSTTRLKLLNKLERYDEALAGAESALAKSTGNSSGSLWLQKAEALRGLGRNAEARAAYQQAISRDGTLSEAGLRLAEMKN